MRDQIYIDAVINRVHQGKFILDQYMEGISLDAAIVGAGQMDIEGLIKVNNI